MSWPLFMSSISLPARRYDAAASQVHRCHGDYCAAGHSWRFEQLDTSNAWNLRAGPQLQWLGSTSRYFVFNDGGCGGPRSRLLAEDGLSGAHGGASNDSSSASIGLVAAASSNDHTAAGGWCAIVYDMQQLTRSRVLPMPVHSVSADGKLAAGYSFQRLQAAVPGATILHLIRPQVPIMLTSTPGAFQRP